MISFHFEVCECRRPCLFRNYLYPVNCQCEIDDNGDDDDVDDAPWLTSTATTIALNRERLIG
jgi:hypothetical protein